MASHTTGVLCYVITLALVLEQKD